MGKYLKIEDMGLGEICILYYTIFFAQLSRS